MSTHEGCTLHVIVPIYTWHICTSIVLCMYIMKWFLNTQSIHVWNSHQCCFMHQEHHETKQRSTPLLKLHTNHFTNNNVAHCMKCLACMHCTVIWWTMVVDMCFDWHLFHPAFCQRKAMQSAMPCNLAWAPHLCLCVCGFSALCAPQKTSATYFRTKLHQVGFLSNFKATCSTSRLLSLGGHSNQSRTPSAPPWQGQWHHWSRRSWHASRTAGTSMV